MGPIFYKRMTNIEFRKECFNGNINKVKELIEYFIKNKIDYDLYGGIQSACISGNKNIVKFLLKQNNDVYNYHIKKSNLRFCLNRSLVKNNYDCALLLISNGDGIDLRYQVPYDKKNYFDYLSKLLIKKHKNKKIINKLFNEMYLPNDINF